MRKPDFDAFVMKAMHRTRECGNCIAFLVCVQTNATCRLYVSGCCFASWKRACKCSEYWIPKVFGIPSVFPFFHLCVSRIFWGYVIFFFKTHLTCEHRHFKIDPSATRTSSSINGAKAIGAELISWILLTRAWFVGAHLRKCESKCSIF